MSMAEVEEQNFSGGSPSIVSSTNLQIEQIINSESQNENFSLETDAIEQEKKKCQFNQRKKLFFVLIIGTISFLVFLGINRQGNLISQTQYYQFQDLKITPIPGEYMNIHKIKEFKELPFCIILDKGEEWQLMQDYVGRYTNYIIVQVQNKEFNYFRFQESINKCQKNSIVIFVDRLKYVDLTYFNDIYQRNKIFLTYHQNKTSIEIVSFYLRVWQLVGMNIFNEENGEILSGFDRRINIEHISMSLFEMCLNNTMNIKPKYSSVSKLAFQKDSAPLKRTPYQTLYKLSQDYFIEASRIDLPTTNFNNLKSQRQGITPQKMKRALEFEQILYLPLNHSLLQLEELYYRQNGLLYQGKEEVRFCVTVLNRNNVDRNRYKKAFNSMFQQNYSNYYVIFMDDMSSDNNTPLLIDYLRKLNQSIEVKIVQNLVHKFATYSIINAAFNYCGADDVQMLLDGDDEFIGRYTFQVINSQYQMKKTWVVYSSYKSNYNEYGDSKNLTNINSVVKDGKRLSNYFIGPIRTWKVKLIHAIPLENHLNHKGVWLDTIYDEAVQYPLFDLCGTADKFSYIPELLYEYNRLYSPVSDYEGVALQNRKASFKKILEHALLKRVYNLDEIERDKEVVEILLKDRGIEYQEIEWA